MQVEVPLEAEVSDPLELESQLVMIHLTECQEVNSGPLEKQCMLLTPETSLQLPGLLQFLQESFSSLLDAKCFGELNAAIPQLFHCRLSQTQVSSETPHIHTVRQSLPTFVFSAF